MSEARVLRCAVVLMALLSMPAAADHWIVYIDGGLQPIAEEGWTERRNQVLFTQHNGALVSVPADSVDLATSAMITWHLDGRRQPPPRVKLPTGAAGSSERRPCVAARVTGLRGAETLDVRIGDRDETVHVACLDAPETRHRLTHLAWYGRAAASWLQVELEVGDAVCLTEQAEPRSDGQGHRIVFVTLDGGRDLTAAMISSGYGMLRAGACVRAADYRQLEDRAIAGERGLWGARAEPAAVAAVSYAGAAGGKATGPPPRRAPARGG